MRERERKRKREIDRALLMVGRMTIKTSKTRERERERERERKEGREEGVEGKATPFLMDYRAQTSIWRCKQIHLSLEEHRGRHCAKDL